MSAEVRRVQLFKIEVPFGRGGVESCVLDRENARIARLPYESRAGLRSYIASLQSLYSVVEVDYDIPSTHIYLCGSHIRVKCIPFEGEEREAIERILQ